MIENNWYQELIADIKTHTQSRIVEAKHYCGQRILQEKEQLESVYGIRFVEKIAQDLDVDKSEIYRCIQFVIKYPELLESLRQLSWFHIARKLLPENVHFSSESNEWTTPAIIIKKIEQIFGQIDLDPCSDIDCNIPALQRYTIEDDGLTKNWIGKIYMNPPYGRELPNWTDKFKAEYLIKNMAEGIALIPARPDTDWFYSLRDYPRCFIRHRLKFGGQQNSAPFPSMVVYVGNNIKKFKHAFQDIGDIYQRIVDRNE